MIEDNKITKFLTKLNKSTQEEKVQWRKPIGHQEKYFGGGEQRTDEGQFITDFNNKTLRIYIYEYKDYHDEEAYTWVKNVSLEFIDYQGNVEWTFPKNRTLWDLFESIQYRYAGVDDFITSFLEDDEN